MKYLFKKGYTPWNKGKNIDFIKQTKICSKCKKIKPLTEFIKRKDRKFGYNSWCKQCHKERRIIYYNKIYKPNKDKFNKKQRDKYKNNLTYRKKQLEYKKQDYLKHKDKRRKYIRQYRYNRRKVDIQFKIKDNISSLINITLRRRLISKNNKSSFTFLPYTVDKLKQHLENQFEPWMNWNNWGKGKGMWNIDHIKPISSFDYTSIEDEKFQKCWALNNLRPLEWYKNCYIKNNKII